MKIIGGKDMNKTEFFLMLINGGKEEYTTQEMYNLVIKYYHVDEKYDNYERHVRNLQQQLKRENLLINSRRGYWKLVQQ